MRRGFWQRRQEMTFQQEFEVGSVRYRVEVTECGSIVLKAIADRRDWSQRAAVFSDPFWYPGREEKYGEPESVESLGAHDNAHAVLRLAASAVIGWIKEHRIGQLCFRALEPRLHRILLRFARRMSRRYRLPYEVDDYEGWILVTRLQRTLAA
ncbi:MAG: hypothetical protein CMK02_12995 [Polycyclovorans sp.]|nr:hypothetical protein [Polycyclovorans sp.]|tara:strand:- start:45 stop:503 length:459 start_codon:yes stop_codon:yes gene_type:complete